MIYLLSSFQWITTFQRATWRDRNLFGFLLPTTSDRSLLATTGGVTAESTGPYFEIIAYTNIMPFSSLGNHWDLDLLEHPASQLGHRNAYSLVLRSESQAHKLLKQGHRCLLEAIASLTWPESKPRQTRRQWHPAILVFRVAAWVQPTLLSRDFCGKWSSSLSKSL